MTIVDEELRRILAEEYEKASGDKDWADLIRTGKTDFDGKSDIEEIAIALSAMRRVSRTDRNGVVAECAAWARKVLSRDDESPEGEAISDAFNAGRNGHGDMSNRVQWLGEELEKQMLRALRQEGE